MIQLRPTFSESWYRVNTLKARLRSSAQISRQFYRGERWYVVRDPAGNQFHRLSDAAYRFIGLLDGSRTIEQAWDICGGQLADDAPTQPEIIQILSHLYAANLIEADITPDATVLLRRHKQLTKRKMQNRLMNVLFPRIPIWDPDKFLCRWMPVVRPVLSWIGAMVWLAVVLFAIAMIAPHWDQLQVAAKNAIDPKNWLWLWAVFVLIKLIHELGHAFSCRRFGGECHELGIMFLVFIPTPYVDASAAWAFPSRWQRMFVGAGGMIVELFVASLLAIAWVLMENKTTLPAVLCYNAMLIASVSTLVFNANPLLRYDGYYILSDFLEIPNLRQKSSEYGLGLIKRHIFRVKATQPLPPVPQRMWLLTYAISSGIYRIFVGFVIVLVVMYKIPILGTLMAIGGVITWAFVPISKVTKYLLLEPELHRKRTRAVAFVGALAALVIVCIGVLTFPVYVDGEAIAEPDKHEVLNVSTPGVVTDIKATDGQIMKAGQVILVATDDRLNADIDTDKAEQQQYEVQIRQAEAVDQAQANALRPELDTVKKQLADAEKRRDELTIRAPIDGELIAPDLINLKGKYLQRGEKIGTVAAFDSLVVRTIVDQEDGQLIFNEKKDFGKKSPDAPSIQVLFAGDLLNTNATDATAERFIDSAQQKLPHKSLSQTGGGDVAMDPSDPRGEHPTVHRFEFDLRVNNPDGRYHPGQRVYVRFKLEKHTLVWNWVRRGLQLLQSHENDSKLT